jgi:hypothetical protein
MEVARAWEAGAARPFFKVNGEDVRPVVCSESLLKFAVGCTVFSLFRGFITIACGRRQFGACRADGAALMIAEIRGAAHLFPERVIAEGDAANAFGSVSRAQGLELVVDKVPQLAPLLAAIWQVVHLTLLLNDGAGGWAHIDACFGVFQGGHDGQPVYCLVVVAVEADFRRILNDAHLVSTPPLWKYVDDGVIQSEVADFEVVWSAWKAANALHRIVLVDSKSAAYVPAWDALQALLAEAAVFEGIMPLQHGGLVLLRGVAEGSYSALVGPADIEESPTSKRCGKACRIADGLVAMANAGLDVAGRLPAWQVARLVVANISVGRE